MNVGMGLIKCKFAGWMNEFSALVILVLSSHMLTFKTHFRNNVQSRLKQFINFFHH